MIEIVKLLICSTNIDPLDISYIMILKEFISIMIIYVPYMWNYWQVEYLAICSKNAIGEIFNWCFECCMERNPCFYSSNSIHLIWQYLNDCQTAKLKPLLNIPHKRYVA